MVSLTLGDVAGFSESDNIATIGANEKVDRLKIMPARSHKTLVVEYLSYVTVRNFSTIWKDVVN